VECAGTTALSDRPGAPAALRADAKAAACRRTPEGVGCAFDTGLFSPWALTLVR